MQEFISQHISFENRIELTPLCEHAKNNKCFISTKCTKKFCFYGFSSPFLIQFLYQKGGEQVIKAYRIRLLPTQEQEEKLWQHVHAARAVWNWGLNYQMELFKNGEKHLSAYSLRKVLTQVKKTDELNWLNDVSFHTMGNVLIDLGNAYKDFFAIKPARFTISKTKKAARTGKKLTPYDLEGHPKFKARRDGKFKFPIRVENTYFVNHCVNVEKIGKIQYQANLKRELPQGKDACKVSNPRIKFIDNKWILSFGIEVCENQAPPLTDNSLGIDLGVKDLAVASFGGKQLTFHNINKSKGMQSLERKKKHLQRGIARKYRTNGNYNKTQNVVKTEKILKRVESRLRNKRHDHTHQTTHKLVSLLPYRVVMEDLNVSGMMKNKHLSKAIQEQCWAEFIRQMKYKSEWNHIEFIQVGRWYPSSKRCSCCGHIKADLKLRDRMYECVACGLTINRDFNAALNLEMYRYVSPETTGQTA